MQNGDKDLRNKFISEYEPFVLKSISRVLNNKFIDKQNFDEFSIGLIAFNKAIDDFDINKGKSFFDFAQLVISRRIINYKISENKNAKTLPISCLKNDESSTDDWFDKKLCNQNFYLDNIDEILDFKKCLQNYNIKIMDLAHKVPKHRDSKKTCIEIARIVAENEQMLNYFKNKKSLPVKEIVKVYKTSRRTIERNKKFIIATVLILSSNLDTIKEFINNLD
jgi:RNA polymerase sigma factor